MLIWTREIHNNDHWFNWNACIILAVAYAIVKVSSNGFIIAISYDIYGWQNVMCYSM